MRRRLTLVLLSLLLLNLNLAGCQSPGSTSAPLDPDSESVTELDVCSTAYTTGVGLDYAEQMGLFSKVGLEVNLVPILNSSNAVAALVAGDVDLCLIGGSAVVNAALAGEDLVFVAGVINQQFYSLVVQPEIKEAEDLKGKVVGVSNPGTLSDTVMRGILESLGLRADEEVLLQAVGKTNERLTAMEAGHIVGTIIMATEVPIAKEMGFKVLVDAADLDTPYQHTGIATKRAFTQSQMEKSRLEGMLEAGNKAASEAVTDVFANIDPDEIRMNPEKLVDVIKTVKDQTEGAVAGALAEFGNMIRAELKASDPEIRDYREQIDALRSDPEFADLDDRMAVKIIKMTQPEKTVKKARGKMGGKSTPKAKSEGSDIRKSAAFLNTYGDLLETKEGK